MCTPRSSRNIKRSFRSSCSSVIPCRPRHRRPTTTRWRAKSNDPCDAESTTRVAEECLERESKLTDANYAAFTTAIRDILALKAPQIGTGTWPLGPTGMPLTSEESVDEFDTSTVGLAAHIAHSYLKPLRPIQGTATLAPVFDGECSQMIVRSAHARAEQDLPRPDRL